MTAVFSIHLGLRQSPNTVAFVDEAEQRVLGRLEAGRFRVVPARGPPRGCARRRGRRSPWPCRRARRPTRSSCAPCPWREPTSQRQPTSVVFFFNEPVEASFAVIRVFDAQGAAVESGTPFRPPRPRATRWRSRCSRTCRRARTRRPTASSPPTRIRSREASSSRSASRAAGRSRRFRARRGRAAQPRSPCGPIAGSATRRSGSPSAPCSSSSGPGAPPWPNERGGSEERWAQASASFDRRLRLLIGIAVAVGVLASLLALPLQGALAAGTSLWGGLDVDVLERGRPHPLRLADDRARGRVGSARRHPADRRRARRRGASAGSPDQSRADRARDAADRLAARLAPSRRTCPHPEPAGAALPGRRRARDGDEPVARRTGDARRRRPGGNAAAGAARARPAPASAALSRFSGVALVSVGALAVSGVAQAVVRGGQHPGPRRHRLRARRAGEEPPARRADRLGRCKPQAADPRASPSRGGGEEPASGSGGRCGATSASRWR